MSGTHVIRRELLEVEVVGTEADAFALQERLSQLSRDRLTPMLERVLERAVPAHEHWSVDRLYIDAGRFRPQNLEHGLVDAVAQALERQLRERAPPAGSSAVSAAAKEYAGVPAPPDAFASPDALEHRSEAKSLQDAFLYFLRTGVLPWWFHLPRDGTLEDRIREIWEAEEQPDARPEHFARALLGIARQASAQQRLVRQFSPDFLGRLLAGISSESAATVREVLAQLTRDALPPQALEEFAEHLWTSAFALAATATSPRAARLIAAALHAMSSGTEPPRVLLVERIARRWPEARQSDGGGNTDRVGEPRAPPRAKRPAPRAAPPGPDLEEGLYVGCAGVVLLHPFLPRLFEALGIATDEELLRAERALALLHFLATGQRSAPEYDLPLAKLLCNVPLDAPVQSRIELTAAEEEEADALLAAVVRHWDALGDTSIDGLRGSFLVRPGKLCRRGSDYVLHVETRSYDLLLDRLPWGIGTIELPWMDDRLWVEWRF